MYGLPNDARDFTIFVSSKMTGPLCAKIERETINQSSASVWYKLRYARITASILHQAAQCKTTEGSLTENIMGATASYENDSMKRGKELEEDVVEQAAKQLKVEKPRKAGLSLYASCPYFGASPDAITDEACFEVKCPSKTSTMKNYKNDDGIPTSKVKAQINLQMYMSGRRKAYLCIVPPDFKVGSEIEIIGLQYDKAYIKELIENAYKFWVNAILNYLFPK